jgi:glucokinase
MMSAIGVDIGGTNVRVARISSNGAILDRRSERTSRDPVALLERLSSVIEEMIDSNVSAVGIGVPGRVDSQAGVVLSGGYVDLALVPLQEELEARLATHVVIDNDCNMALVGEAALGAARSVRSSAMLTLGTGIGGALLQNGEIVRGRRCAGQLGHIVIDRTGLPCNCGRLGCLETTSSGTSLQRIFNEHGLPASTTIESVIDRADKQDSVALAVLEAWGGPLCAAIDILSSSFDPDVVLLGGGLGRAGWEVVKRLQRRPSWGEICPVAPATLGDDAGIIGAALSGLKHARLSEFRTKTSAPEGPKA